LSRFLAAQALVPSKADMSADSEERLPWQVTRSSAIYDAIDRLPVSIVLENVRSMYNVGAFFRTADASGAARLYLCGITASPPKHAISKTALGAEEVVPWEHTWDAPGLVTRLRAEGCEIAAIETSLHAIDVFDWQPRFPVALLYGHETDGLTSELSARADTHVRIPMLGKKHSLNVATAGGVVLFELLRKYRVLCGR
jgi:23S rRNA (guanosine2251-2'-O)-methyltransferase